MLKIFLICILISFVMNKTTEMDYGLMIDAGSTGSRIHIYEWPHRTSDALPLVVTAPIGQVGWSLKVSPGISSFASNPQGAVDSLAPLLEYANGKIEASKRKSTPVYLLATAGMRMLDENTQNQILNAIRGNFSKSGYQFENSFARVINGSMEGVFGWVTTNYLLANLNTTSPTEGALDMGGASTQITFEVNKTQNMPSEYFYQLTLSGKSFNLYTHSFLGYGSDSARRRFIEQILPRDEENRDIENPCFPLGYSVEYTINSTVYTVSGTSDYSSCYHYSTLLLNLTAPCPVANCSFNGVFQPHLQGNFVAFSGYYYTTSFLGVDNGTIEEWKSAAETFCELDYQELVEKYRNSSDWEYIDEYCLNSAYYINVLLAYGFNDSSHHITFESKIKNYDLSWTLGAMIYQANLLSWGTKNKNVALIVSLSVVGAVIAIALIILIIYIVKKKQHGYQKLDY